MKRTSLIKWFGITAVVGVGVLCGPVARGAGGSIVAWGCNSSGQTDVPPGLTNVTAIAAGTAHSLALTSDGTVVAWGSNLWGQTNVPAGLTNVVAIAAGGICSSALKADGTVAFWGGFGARPPADLTNAVAVACGGAHGLAIRADGSVVSWQGGGSGGGSLPELSNAVAVAGGTNFNLALKADGTVAYSQYFGTPPPSSFTGLSAIAAADYFGVGLASNAMVVTWLQGGPGGQVDPILTNVPGSLSNVVAISARADHTLALLADDTLVAWGHNESGQCTIPAGLGHVLAIAAGGSHNLVLVNNGPVITQQPQCRYYAAGEIVTFAVSAQGNGLSYQWQFNGTNIDGATTNTLTLTNVTANQVGPYAVVVSNAFGSVRSADAWLSVEPRVVLAWGDNEYGQTTVPACMGKVIAVAAGDYHGLALRSDGTVVGWGSNTWGQTTAPAGLTNVVMIAAGGYHSLALRAEGTVVAWGQNLGGQADVPAGLTDVVSIKAGWAFSLALKADGTVVGWGQSLEGQAIVPGNLTKAVAIGAGTFHGLALRANGTVAAWGWNSDGQTDVPDGLDNVIAITAGHVHNLALRSDGTVVAWGRNVEGQCNVPSGLSGVVAIGAGGQHSVALKSDGTVVAWGSNQFGQLNVPSSGNVVMIAAGYYYNLALVGDGSPTLQAPLVSASCSANRFRTSVATQSGRAYGLERAVAIGGDWIPLPLTAGNGAVLTLTDPAATNSQCFYRVRQW
jgi:alpha-tubulin suppressor-like RCC1 family protein